MATAPPQADSVLVRRLRERDRTAWEELYDEYGGRLRGFAYRLTGNPHDADDLVQETFVRALPRLDRLDPDTVDLGPYLFTTLRNLFLKSVERGRRAEPVAEVPEPAEAAPIEDDPERSTLLHRQQEEVRGANAQLAPRQRLVLALRELEDKSYAEIGLIVGLNENAVAQLISRARESLRLELRLAQVDPSRLPEECRLNLPLLSRHLDGQLREPQLAATLAHLEGCSLCQDALDSMREAKRRYRLLPPWLFAGDELRKRIDAELTAVRYWEGPSRWLGRWGAVVAAVAALFALGGGGVGAALVLGGGDDPVVEALKTVSRATSTTGPATTTPKPATTTQPATRPAPAPSTTSASVLATTTAATTTEVTTTVATAPATTTAAAPQPEPAPVAPPSSAAAKPVPKPPTVPAPPKPPTASTPRPSPPTVPSPPPTTLPPPDTTPPTTSIVSAATTGADASFQFTASESGSAFSCALDGGAFAGCSTPHAYSGLAPGAHTFAVRATDAAGNTGAPATHAWTIAPPPPPPPPPLPDLIVSALSKSGFAVTNTGTAAAGPFVVSVTLIGTFTIPGLAAGQTVTRTWSICRVGTITAIADRGADVAESNERNNARSIASTC